MAFHTGGAQCEALEAGKVTKGVFNVYELKIVAGVSRYIVVGEGVDNICGIRASVLWTLLAVAQGVWQLCG